MKTIILPAIIALALVAGSNAINKRFEAAGLSNYDHSSNMVVNEQNAGDSLFTLDQLKNQLALTSDQVLVVDSILTSASQQLSGVTDIQQEQQIINNAYSAIENILTVDQRTKFDAMKSQSSSSGY